MKEILVAIDGAKHSSRIVETAVELAKSISAKIALLYIVPSFEVPQGYSKYAKSEGVDSSTYFEAVARQVVADLGERVVKAGLELEELTEFGNPAATILKVAKSRNDYAVVVGVQGLHGLGRIRALGSVSRRVIENSDLPVICVP